MNLITNCMALLPQLKLSAPKRSNFDLSYINRFTASPGVLIPAMYQRCIPGDHYEIQMKHLIKTFALKAPLMGRMLCKFDLFFVPDRLYVPEFRSNDVDASLFADKMDVQMPYFNMPLNGTQNGNDLNTPLSECTLLDFIGMPVGFRDAQSPQNSSESTAHYGMNSIRFNALPILAYWDIWRNYYRNPQESDGYVFGTEGGVVPNDLGLTRFDASQLDTYMRIFQEGSIKNLCYNVGDMNSISQVQYNQPWSFCALSPENIVNPMSGLLLRCYQPDYFTNFINTSVYDRISTQAGGLVVVGGDSRTGTFTVNQFRLANKLQKLAERAIIAGNRYGEYIRAMFGVKTDDKLDIPEYLGSYTSSMDFQDIVNTYRPESYSPNRSEEPYNALGASGGRGVNANQSGKFYVNTTEYGYLVCMFSIVPSPDYYTGVKKELTKTWLSDEFNPQLDRLGWQPLMLSEYGFDFDSWNSEGSNPFAQVCGYQPAWLEYMTRTNELHGDFSTTLNYWTIGRRFNRQVTNGLDEYVFPSAYIFPTDFSAPFVDSSTNARNFMVQIAFDIFAKRPISKKLMPNLG